MNTYKVFSNIKQNVPTAVRILTTRKTVTAWISPSGMMLTELEITPDLLTKVKNRLLTKQLLDEDYGIRKVKTIKPVVKKVKKVQTKREELPLSVVEKVPDKVPEKIPEKVIDLDPVNIASQVPTRRRRRQRR